MPETSELASQISIKVDGTEVQPDVMANMLALTVDQHAHLPAMFTIRMQDSDFEILDNGPFNLTKQVEIAAEKPDGESVVLLKGEITALEPDFQEGMISYVVVRGYDPSHRLYRETKSKAFLNKKDSDLAQEIAQAAGLQTEIETTSTVYDHIFQHNQSDLVFLQQRAWRIGYECFVAEGKLTFRKPLTSGQGVELSWGDELVSFRPRMTLAEQVSEVVVKGWDPSQKAPIVGRAEQGNLYPNVEEQQNGAEWAQSFGTGKLIVMDQPVISQAEADALAAARLDELSGVFVEAEGVASRRPDIRAGQMITLSGLGERFSGTYLVTAATHAYTPEGLKTTFQVRGSRTGALSEQLGGSQRQDRWYGVVVGIVTNTDDPQAWGRVKVKFPWMTDDAESAWARVMGLGAGPESGLFIVPEVDDEVLVMFEHGDFNYPVVIGGLWNGQEAIPPEASSASSGEKPKVRTWHSRSGHRIAVYDTSDNKIEIVTQGGHQIVLDDAGQEIKIVTSSGGLEVTLSDSSSQVQIKSSGNMKLEANGNIDLQAGGQVTVRGAVINLN